MKDFIVIACGAGMQDGVNPCILMACAVFIIHGKWLKKNSFRLVWLRTVYCTIYWLGFLLFNFGPGQMLTYRKNFIFSAKIIYFILGVGALFYGFKFFKEWYLLLRGIPVENPVLEKAKPGDLVVRLTTIIIAVILSALASLWPINSYILLLGSAAILKGQSRLGLPLWLIYTFITMWPLWIVWAFISTKNLRPSLLKIVCAAIFFSASSCMIFIFK